MTLIVIEFRKANKPGTFWPFHCGRQLTKATRQPFFDGALALLAEGAAPDWRLIGRHEGSSTVALQSTVGEAASWSVSEPDRGKCKRIPYQPYKPDSSVTVDASGDDAGSGASTEPPISSEGIFRGGITHGPGSPIVAEHSGPSDLAKRCVPKYPEEWR